jgi:hypothetical protein
MDLDKIVLVYPKRDGRIFGRAHGAPYTLMRLASLVPPEIPVEIWDEDLRPLDFARVTPRTLMGDHEQDAGDRSRERDRASRAATRRDGSRRRNARHARAGRGGGMGGRDCRRRSVPHLASDH